MKLVFLRIQSCLFLLLLVMLCGCKSERRHIRFALRMAGENKTELETVLNYYKTVDKDPEKLKAAEYLIANMPAHYSYADTSIVNNFYKDALKILKSGNNAQWQRDTILLISNQNYPGMSWNTVSDVKVIKSDYLIYSIDHAFTQWRTRPWAKHLTFEEFRDWLLPYKVTELQSFDSWRDTLSAYFSDSLSNLPANNDQCYTIYGALDIVRNEMVRKLNPYIAWTTASGYPLLNAETMANMTYGSCYDYVILANAVFKSVGLPTNVDIVPIWGRSHEGHSWYTILTDNGIQSPAQNDITIPAGWGFYPYQRFPKIYRESYAINRETARYKNEAKKVLDFDVFKFDITDKYYRTSDVNIPITKNVELKDKYVYIATLASNNGPIWYYLDFGVVKKGNACFKKMGRELLYLAMGFDGKDIVPITDPFIINKDGSISYVTCDTTSTRTVIVKRKYYQSYNVVDMRRRILGAKIQCANHADFSDSITIYKIEDTDIPDKIHLNNSSPYRYWRLLSADGTYGSVAELAFFDSEDNKMDGQPISCLGTGTDETQRAFDEDLLSNFETYNPNGNWVGMDMKDESVVSSVRVVPRSDDNDVCPGNLYELLFWNGDEWVSLGSKLAEDNSLLYENVPKGCLFWLRNYTRGWAERPFTIDDNLNVMWW